jgi:type IV secretory pathway VirJ component
MSITLVRRVRWLVVARTAILLLSLSNGACAQSADTTVAGLPVIEVPATGANSGTFAIFLSGDGGWADVDRQVSAALAQRGIGVVGVNSRSYLSKRKTPEQAATDVDRIARTYMARWHAQRVALVGYSRGADILPFIANRLSSDLRSHVALIAMLGLAHAANFQFHLIDLIEDVHRKDDVPVAPELEKLRGQRMLCVYGTKEKDSGCRDADSTLVTRVGREGGHHFDSNYGALADLIISMLGGQS